MSFLSLSSCGTNLVLQPSRFFRAAVNNLLDLIRRPPAGDCCFRGQAQSGLPISHPAGNHHFQTTVNAVRISTHTGIVLPCKANLPAPMFLNPQALVCMESCPSLQGVRLRSSPQNSRWYSPSVVPSWVGSPHEPWAGQGLVRTMACIPGKPIP